MTARRGPDASAEELRADLAALREEITVLRGQLRATAALAAGIGFRTAPATTNGAVTTVKQLCMINGVAHHAETISKLFS